MYLLIYLFIHLPYHFMYCLIGNTILNFLVVVPDGVVIFFPSYSYEEIVFRRWSEQGFISRFEKKKKVQTSKQTNKTNKQITNKIVFRRWPLFLVLKEKKGKLINKQTNQQI
jgi:Rad3-related DNA helicase